MWKNPWRKCIITRGDQKKREEHLEFTAELLFVLVS